MHIGEVDVSRIILDAKSRDDIPQILRELQYLYIDSAWHGGMGAPGLRVAFDQRQYGMWLTCINTHHWPSASNAERSWLGCLAITPDTS